MSYDTTVVNGKSAHAVRYWFLVDDVRPGLFVFEASYRYRYQTKFLHSVNNYAKFVLCLDYAENVQQ